MTDKELEDQIIRQLGRRMYLRWCQATDKKPHRQPHYVPPWALDYAEVAIDFLGYPEDMVPGRSA